LLQQAARHAQERGRRDVDTENLLYALTASDVIQAILAQVKISPEDLKQYIDENAPRGDAKKSLSEVGVTRQLWDDLSRALTASLPIAYLLHMLRSVMGHLPASWSLRLRQDHARLYSSALDSGHNRHEQ